MPRNSGPSFFWRNNSLVFSRHLHPGVQHNLLHIERSERQEELVGILKLDRNPASGRAQTCGQTGSRLQLHVITNPDLRSRSGGLTVEGRSACRVPSYDDRLDLRSDRGWKPEGIGQLVRQFDSLSVRILRHSAPSTALRNRKSRTLTCGMIDSGVDVEGAAEPVDPKHQHEKDRYHQSGFCDF